VWFSFAVIALRGNESCFGACCCSCCWGFACGNIGFFCHAAGERAKTRLAHGINGGTMEDYLAICCCHPCALTQEKRELQLRNSQKQAPQQVTMIVA